MPLSTAFCVRGSPPSHWTGNGVPRKNSFYLLTPPLFPTGHFLSSGLRDALFPVTSHMSLKLSTIFSTGLWTCRKDCVLYASMVAISVDTQRFINTKLLGKWCWQIISWNPESSKQSHDQFRLKFFKTIPQCSQEVIWFAPKLPSDFLAFKKLHKC